MATLALDTLRVSKRLREAGFSEPQADAVTGIRSDSREASLSELATKADVRDAKSELKLEIADVRLELGAVKADVAVLKWMAGFNIALSVGIILKLFAA